VEEPPGFIIARPVGKRIRLILLTGMNMEQKSPEMCICMGISGFSLPMAAYGTMSSMGDLTKSNV